ncbi:MAG: transaldolase [Epsilonproteobacteria bacterium]|nr:transaldolase [Campylobacterota bacterium]
MNYSLWLDFIERDFLKTEFKQLLGTITGATSNPSIFKDAILNSNAYKEQLSQLKNLSPKEKYEALAVEDIKTAAKLLLPLFEKGKYGFVSIEVDPRLKDDVDGTINEAKRLLSKIDLPNVMIKIPVTPAGCEAIEELVAQGVNVNATLIFSPHQASECLDAMERGFKKNKNSNCVLSVFVSRFDRKLDPYLKAQGLPTGKVGIMNAAKIYNMVRKRELPNTKTLFASTGVKDDSYPKHYYISNLVAQDAINTAPLEAIKSFLQEGDNREKLPYSNEEIEEFFNRLKAHRIDMKKVYYELLEEGLKAFIEAFEEILKELDESIHL